jgi:hypothetical protein
MSHLILSSIQNANPERLQKAVCGLADGSYQVYLTQQDNRHVQGSVISGEGKEYAVSIDERFLSCGCPDFSYRGTTCKHLLAFALRILQTEECTHA